MSKANYKEVKKKKEEHFIENTEVKLKSQRIAEKRYQKQLKKLENSNPKYNNLNEEVELDATVHNITQKRKRESEKIENNQDIEQSEKVKLISVDQGFDYLQENLQRVREAFKKIDSQFQHKLKMLKQQPHEQINKQKKRKINYESNQQKIYKDWQKEKSNKWNEFQKQKIVREYYDSSQLQKQRVIKSQTKIVRSSNIQYREEQIFNELKSLNDKIQRWESKQQNLLNKIQWLMLNFYMRTKYKNKQSYKSIMIKASQTILNVFQQKRSDFDQKSRDKYVQELKYNLYQVGINYLNYSNKEDSLQNFKLWTQFKKYFQDILNTKAINFLAFRLEDQTLDFQMRYMFFEASFYNFLRKCKTKYQTQQLAQTQNINKNINDLTQLSIKKSHIYYYEKDIKRLEKLVQVVKNSWFIRSQLVYYIRDRKQYLKNYKNENEKKNKLKGKQKYQYQYDQEQEQEQAQDQTLEKITKYINKAQVTFIDYSTTSVNGITLTSSQDYKQYPIFINLYSLFQKNVTNFGFFQSYTLFVLIHQLAHSVIRKCEFFKKGDSSNHYNTEEDKKMDGGWLFQYLLFGKANQVFSSKDYQQVMELLKLTQCPEYLKNKDPTNKKQYEELTNDNKKYFVAKQRNVNQDQSYQRVYKFSKNRHIEKQLNDQLKNLEVFVEQHNQNTKQIQKIKRQGQNKIDPEIEKQKKPNKKQVLKMIQTISSFGKRIPNQKQIISQQFMTLKTGIENLLGHQFMVLDSHCGTHYK